MRDRVEIELDDQGRLVLPLPLAHRLGLVLGTQLVVDQETPEATYVRVQALGPAVVEKGGVVVITAGVEEPLAAILHTEREQRLNALWGRDDAPLP